MSDEMTVIQASMPKARLRVMRRRAINRLAALREELSTTNPTGKQKESLENEIASQKVCVTELQESGYESMMSAMWLYRIKKGKELHPYFGGK